LGRVVDATSKPIDGNGDIIGLKDSPVLKSVVNPLMRQGVDEILPTGIKAIDGFTTLGKGQRVGLFAGSGVGKSTLISSICNHVVADVKVIALVGERGREVEEFVSQTLGDEGIKNSVVIASTAQESPLNRVQAAYSAITIAEYFANSGNDVFFAMDSITRFATALREVGLAAGEPPTVKGYTPSVFSAIPNLIERCGNFKGKGSISAMFSVLVESDDFNDPIVDCTRAILDGHILLSRDLAEQSHFPAIDIAKSISRLQSKLVSPESIRLTRELRKVFSNYQQNREILELGFFDSSDGNPQQKSLKNNWRNLEAFLLQNSHESLSLDAIQKQLEKIEIE
jgi:flagellum-specific ATP synthase